MKKILTALCLSALVITISYSCNQDKPLLPQSPDKEDISGKREITVPKPEEAHIRALKSLGLKPIDVDSLHLPNLPEPFEHRQTKGADSLFTELMEKLKDTGDRKAVFLGIPFNTSYYLIWAYGRPSGVSLGDRTRPGEINGDGPVEGWSGKPYLPLTFRYSTPIEGYSRPKRVAPYLQHHFDSLMRLHRVAPLREADNLFTPMPYDLRHIRIAREGE